MPGLGATFGRGAATTYTQDLANADLVVFMGSNMAEAHPVGFRWPLRAKEHGGTLVHIDPRFSRTSALCDLFVGIRAGTDIAFLGGVINYILTHELYFKEFVAAYSNASVLIEDGFGDTEDLAGLFSGFKPGENHYDPTEGHWSYESESGDKADESKHKSGDGTHGATHQGNAGDAVLDPKRDPTYRHPRCVMQILKRHFARYTPETVADVCGVTAEEVVRIAKLFAENSGRERTATIVYAVGWTQHTTGVQIIRTAGILQLLLGNIGRPGGGVMAMRGHSSIQGSTDVSTLYDTLPGYLPQPTDRPEHDHLASYLEQETVPGGYWSNMPKFVVSQLKAWYGDNATAANEFGFGLLPRVHGDYSYLVEFDRMTKGEVKGYLVFGQNPAGGGMNAGLQRAGLRKLDWLVVVDWFETETACFWKSDPTGPPPSEVGTEVFFLPAANIVEKSGSLTNTQRLLQFHTQVMDPPDDCRSDAWIVYQLGLRLKAMYANSTDPRDAAINALTWDYEPRHAHKLADGTASRIEGEPDVTRVLEEVNGRKFADGRLLEGFHELADDGSTACGCWIYSGVTPSAGRNRAAERARTPGNPVEPNWGYAWPANRRVLYNRASADPEGKPWSERKKLLWWDAAKRHWDGPDVPDFEVDKPPSYRPPPGAKGMAAISGAVPFTLKPDGLGWLYAPRGVKDGPLPCHYEPIESPVGNLFYPRRPTSPTVRRLEGPLNPLTTTASEQYPLVAFTFRLTEHYLSGPMSRFNSWLNELMPGMFCEVSPELAAERGFGNGEWVTVSSARGAIACRALVTRRIRHLTVEGKSLHQVGLPFHWSFAGEVAGGNANDLTAILADVNVSMHEGKVFACQIQPGLHHAKMPVATKEHSPWPNHDLTPLTPAGAQPEGQFAHG